MKYQYEAYKEEYFDQVAELESILWTSSIEVNKNIMKDKYLGNPFQDRVIGIVAMYGYQVIGFRGFIVTEWSLNNKKYQFLQPADVCVHPDHRRKGIFTRMNIEALKYFENSNYSGYLNLSSNQYSTPGYLKMGWYPIAKKTKIRMINTFWRRYQRNEANYDKFNNIRIEISDDLNYNVIAKLKSNKIGVLQLNYGIEYYNYKLSRNTNYKFYYLYKDHNPMAYALINIKNTTHAYLDDFGFVDKEYIMKLLKFISKEYFMFFIPEVSINIRFCESIISKIYKCYTLRNTTPIMYRPIKRNINESDYFIDGLDTRILKSWEFQYLYVE